MLMKGADLKERDIEQATKAGEKASTGNLEMLLPKLKKTHEFQNDQISTR